MTVDPSVGPPEPEITEAPQNRVPKEPSPRKKGWGCGVWALIAVALFFFGTTMLFLLVLVAGVMAAEGDLNKAAATPSYKRLVQRTIEGEGREKILVLPIRGIIQDTAEDGLLHHDPGMIRNVKDTLRAAQEDEAVRGVILSVDSPGGGITASDIVRRELMQFKEKTGIPVVALFEDVAASGGYYVATAADHIVAHPTTVTGSIGVIMPLFGAKDLLQKIGVTPRPIKSGELKDSGAFYRDLSAEETAYLQDIVDEYHQRFVDLVFEGMQGRGVEITRDDLVEYCDGRILTGAQAAKVGFVDQVGYFEEALDAVCARAGVPPSETQLVTYGRKPGLLEMFLGRAPAPRATSITIDLEALKGARTPRFMYLWTVGD